nr:MAG TPA: Papain fold toxin 1, glutamine deamidase [Caudoviricetes sp.]
MDKHYYAVTRVGLEDELQHWKYIKKIKVKGKWKYFYDKEELERFEKGYEKTTEKKDKNGNTETVTTVYKKTNDLFGGKTSVQKDGVNMYSGKKWKITSIEKSQGKVDRLIAKGEKFIFNKFLKNKKAKKPGSSAFSKAIDKGKNFINKLFGKDDSKKESKKKKPKYITKVKMPNGKIRYFYSKDEYNAYLKRLEYQKNEPDFMKKIKKIDKNKMFSADENQAATNPNYDPYDKDYSENCIKCTATYELRMRGYDVEAASRTKLPIMFGNQTNADLDNWYKDAKHYEIQEDGSVKDISLTRKNKFFTAVSETYKYAKGDYKLSYSGKVLKESLEKNNPPNSRGNLNVVWDSGGGHSMVYEINSKGKAIIRDAQTNDIYKSDDDFDAVARTCGNISFTRTDNLELRKDILQNVKRK